MLKCDKQILDTIGLYFFSQTSFIYLISPILKIKKYTAPDSIYTQQTLPHFTTYTQTLPQPSFHPQGRCYYLTFRWAAPFTTLSLTTGVVFLS